MKPISRSCDLNVSEQRLTQLSKIVGKRNFSTFRYQLRPRLHDARTKNDVYVRSAKFNSDRLELVLLLLVVYLSPASELADHGLYLDRFPDRPKHDRPECRWFFRLNKV